MKKIISCSRRTDIVAFYMDWFLDCLKNAKVEITNPITKKIFVKSLSKNEVAGFVFWSKNYKNLIANFSKIKGYKKYFHFTINDYNPILETGLNASLKDRLEQIKVLSDLNGPNSIMWRYDPIVHWISKEKTQNNNFKNFDFIAESVAKIGIKNLTFSFMGIYKKTIKKGKQHNIKFFDPNIKTKEKIVKHIIKVCNSLGIHIYTCSSIEIEEKFNIDKAKCINGELLSKLWREKLSIAKDQSQRKEFGCGCTKSIDIGSYNKHRCYHNCLYCYANPYIR